MTKTGKTVVFLAAALAAQAPNPAARAAGAAPDALAALSAPCAHAEEARPSIVDARIYSENGEIVCDLKSRGLFSEKITGTIRSGLPAVVELFFHLLETGGGSVAGGVVSWSLEYDVWDDRYAVTSGDSTALFTGLESMRAMIENLNGIPLVPLGRTEPGGSYRLRMSISVNPLKGTGAKEIEGWVDRNVRGGTEDSRREQVLSVNDLISYFFSRGKDRPNRSEWFISQPFTPSTLAPKTGTGTNGHEIKTGRPPGDAANPVLPPGDAVPSGAPRPGRSKN